MPFCYLAKRGMEVLVFVDWSSNFSTPRNLGMVYCQDKPFHLHAIEAPVLDSSISYYCLLGFWKFGSVSQVFSNSLCSTATF
jgi:hypothetical protein